MVGSTRIGWPVTVAGPDGNGIACQVAGPAGGPAVVLTSGIGCGPVFYKHIAPELARDHRVVYWDYRAHGASTPAPDGRGYAIADHARDLEAVVQATTRGAPLLVGFSMGVQVTVEWARSWGEHAAGFVFLLGMPRNPLGHHQVLGRRQLHRAARLLLDHGPGAALALLHPLSKATLRSPLSYAVAKRTGLVTGRFSPEDFYEFIRYSSAIPLDAYLRTALGVLEHDGIDCWRGLRARTLYLAAERDILVRARECARVGPLLPNGTYDEIEGASHAGTVEAGLALARRIRAFADEVGERERAPIPSLPSSIPRRTPHAEPRELTLPGLGGAYG